MLSKKIRQYLIDFLVGSLWVQSEGDDRFQRRFEAIGYTDDPEQMKLYPIVIIPSGFFKMDVYGTEESMPTLPLKTWRGIPLLFGEPERSGALTGVSSSSMPTSSPRPTSSSPAMRRCTDAVSVTPMGASLGRVRSPIEQASCTAPSSTSTAKPSDTILLETGIAERHNLRLEERPQTFSRVNLTHDLSRPYNYRGWRSFLRAWLKQKKSPLEAARLSFSADVEDDYFTFPKFLKWDRNTCDSLGRDRSDIFLFIRMPSRHPLDKPYYSLHSLYLRRILSIAAKHKVLLALQCSYAAGHQSELISKERHQFEKAFRQRPRGLRHNKLTSCEPEDLLQAYVSGFRNDYSMGYADVVGFRLGTCRPVKFINPNTRLLTELILHPLVLRDLTLSDQRYMALEQDEAERIAHDLIRTTARYNGELTLLWHNDLLSQKTHPWHSVLYRSMLRLIEELGAEPQA